MTDCVFCKIVEGKIHSRKLYEDDDMLAFHDINPLAPVHFMIIPKKHVDSLAAVGPEHAQVLGKMMVKANALAREAGSAEGFRTIVNTGKIARQDVYHLHIHIIGGPTPLGRMVAKES
jgi:histidine triad (HIT) family protein